MCSLFLAFVDVSSLFYEFSSMCGELYLELVFRGGWGTLQAVKYCGQISTVGTVSITVAVSHSALDCHIDYACTLSIKMCVRGYSAVSQWSLAHIQRDNCW